MTVTIFHNPACGTSRTTLAAIRDTGVEPVVVEDLKAGWTKAQLQDLLGKLGLGPRDVLRTKGALAADLGVIELGEESFLASDLISFLPHAFLKLRR